MAVAGLKNLCVPSLLYFIFSMVIIFVMAFQNLGNDKVYCLGSFTCDVSSVYLIFILKIIYVLFWTWVLNLICRAGAPGISWLLVLFPVILFFVLLAAMMVSV
jgi:hypothetical protein